MIIHYLVGSMSACRRGEFGSTDRAAVTCKRCHALMDAGAERPLQPYLPSGRKPIRRRNACTKCRGSQTVGDEICPRCGGTGKRDYGPEPKETMESCGLRIVLDAAPQKLKKVDYP